MDTVRKTHFGGFDDDEEEEDPDAVCFVIILFTFLMLTTLLNSLLVKRPRPKSWRRSWQKARSTR